MICINIEDANEVKIMCDGFLKFDVVSGKNTSKMCMIYVKKQDNIQLIKSEVV